MIRELLKHHNASDPSQMFALITSGDNAVLAHIKPDNTYIERWHHNRFNFDFSNVTGSSLTETQAGSSIGDINLSQSGHYCSLFHNIGAILGVLKLPVIHVGNGSYSDSVFDSVNALVQDSARTTCVSHELIDHELHPAKLARAFPRISTLAIPSFVRILLFRVRLSIANGDLENAIDEMYEGVYHLVVKENYKYIDAVLDCCDVQDNNISVCLSLLTITKGIASKLTRRVDFYGKLNHFLFIRRGVDQAKRLLYGLQ